MGHPKAMGTMAVDTFAGDAFRGKVAIVTGASHGMGRVFAQGFAALGAKVALADIDAKAAEAAAREIGANAMAVEVDVTDDQQIEAGVGRVVDRFGGLHILVNNAGLHMERYNECSTLPRHLWKKLFDVNLFGPVGCARAVRIPMAESGGGVIVNQSSMSARIFPGGAYGASKLALNHVTMDLACELAADGIRVVGIAPGMINTEKVLDNLDEKWQQRTIARQLVKRFGTMDDVLGLVLWLCSDAAGFVTGQTFTIDGGYFPRA